MKTRTITAPELRAGDEIYLDSSLTVGSVEEGTEPTFLPGQTVTVVRGVNGFGHPVAKWVRNSATLRVRR